MIKVMLAEFNSLNKVKMTGAVGFGSN